MLKSITPSRRVLFALVAIAALGSAATVEARSGRGGSLGSRGANTFSAPPATNTAPRPAQPLERTTAQPGQFAPNPAGQVRPGIPSPAPSRGLFGGFGGALMGGLIGAGIFGLLSGSGLFSGLSGFGSIFGLMMQFALIGGLVYLAVRFFRGRQQSGSPAGMMAREATAMGGASPAAGYGRTVPPAGGFGPGGGMGSGPAVQPGVLGPLGIDKSDYDAFEKLLGDIQTAYGREDVAALRNLTTTEMLSYLAEDLAENARKGVIEKVTEPKLLKGDLAEAWRESDAEYATVAMHFSLVDVTVERATGKVVEGDPVKPVEVTEIWTFRRGRDGDDWKLSAIQQA